MYRWSIKKKKKRVEKGRKRQRERKGVKIVAYRAKQKRKAEGLKKNNTKKCRQIRKREGKGDRKEERGHRCWPYRIRRTKAQLAHCCAALPSYCASNRTVPLGHPCRAVECFRAECLRRRAGKHTRCRGSRSRKLCLTHPFLFLSALNQLGRRYFHPTPSHSSSDITHPVNVKNEQLHRVELIADRVR